MPSIEQCVSWLCRFDQNYRQALAVTERSNLNYMYNRSVSIGGIYDCKLIAKFVSLGSMADALGYAVHLQISAKDVVEVSQAEISALRLSRCMIVADADILPQSLQFRRLLATLIALSEAGILLSLAGKIDVWLRSCILEDKHLSARNIRLIPPVTIPEEMSVDFDPCARRFALHIDSDGMIYPCNGTVGLPWCSLGTVFDEPASLFIRSDYPVNLSTLANIGPQGISIRATESVSLLPAVCVAHRQMLIDEH